MPDLQNPRVAVYLDFDNIVMSWYDRVHGRNAYAADRQKIIADPDQPEIAQKLKDATIDVGAIIDYAASFGTLVLTRAYADWSSPVNAFYRTQLVARAVDLVQLFPAAAYAKNGADIRLAVDTVEDMFRLPDLTHVVIVAGDSDYVPLAQRCKRLGRVVVGVGVAGSTAKSLAAACDQFDAYDSLPGVTPPEKPVAKKTTDAAAAPATAAARRRKKPEDPTAELLRRALILERERTDDEWVHLSAVKNLLKRMDPSFSEKALGHRSFSDFVKAHATIADIDETTNIVRVRLHNAEDAAAPQDSDTV
ncbi:NYN domain-containing protein [Microbacterium aurum]